MRASTAAARQRDPAGKEREEQRVRRKRVETKSGQTGRGRLFTPRLNCAALVSAEVRPMGTPCRNKERGTRLKNYDRKDRYKIRARGLRFEDSFMRATPVTTPEQKAYFKAVPMSGIAYHVFG